MAKVDKFKITQIVLKDLKDTKSEIDRLNKLYRFIKRMWKLNEPMEVNPPKGVFFADPSYFTWHHIYSDLEYYSDRWNFSRLYAIYMHYIANCKMIELSNPNVKWKR